LTNKTEFELKSGSIVGGAIIRIPWHRRGVFGWLRSIFGWRTPKPTLWATATFDEGVTIRNGDALKIRYTIGTKDENGLRN
jgi:hypothetical protein